MLTQYVWARHAGGYVDELIQLAHNADPLDGTEQDCEQFYYALQNANFNVLGLIAETGEVVERYEYTPYGQRTVYTTAGSADPAAHTPTLMSQRVELAGVAQPYALNALGHQGLMHDEATGLIYNRARMLHPRLGRFLQREPLGYVDGMSVYQYVLSNSLVYVDPDGLFARWIRDIVLWTDSRMLEENQRKIARRARGIGREDIAKQAEQAWEDFDSNVASESWKAATGCKRKCGESVWECVNRIGESADVIDQTADWVGDLLPGAERLVGVGSSPGEAAAFAARGMAAGAYAEAQGAKVGARILEASVKHQQALVDLARGAGAGGGRNSLASVSNDLARQTQRALGRHTGRGVSIAKGALRGAGGGLAQWAAWEGGLRAGALAHCSCEPE